MVSLPLWVWVAATLGWCGAAMGVSFTIARQGSGGIKGKKLAVIGPFLVLPFMLLSALLPWANARVTLNFTYCWVTPCKLLLLGGANFLLDSPGWTLASFSHFLIAMLLPVRIKGVGKGGVGVGKRLRALLVRLGALVSFFWWYDGMGERVRHGVHCGVLYLVLDLPHRIASMGLEVGWGVETQPAFCRPWLSTSLTDFWGNRWDLTANALLRHSVYNPIVNLLLRLPTRSAPLLSSTYTPKNLHHLLHWSVAAPAAAEEMAMKERGAAPRAKIEVKPGSCVQSAASLLSRPSQPLPLYVRLIGVNTTFFISGLIHELLYFSLTQAAAPTWEVTAFFIVHGLATSAEITLRRACPRHAIFQMPRPLKIVITMSFMYATTASLFFPQLVRAAIFMTCTVEYRAIKEMLGLRSLNTNMLITLASQMIL